MSHPNWTPAAEDAAGVRGCTRGLCPCCKPGTLRGGAPRSLGVDLGESHLELQVEGAPSTQQWRRRSRHLYTEERPLGLIRYAENLRRGTAKVVGGLASRGAERRGCARSNCGWGMGLFGGVWWRRRVVAKGRKLIGVMRRRFCEGRRVVWSGRMMGATRRSVAGGGEGEGDWSESRATVKV